MEAFNNDPITIIISGSEVDQIKTYLKIFLASEKLAEKELNVAAELVRRYAIYLKDGLKEPYASYYLFSTDIRKEVSDMLNMSAQHLSNTLITLAKKNVVASLNKSYILNPALLPTRVLTFKFGGK